MKKIIITIVLMLLATAVVFLVFAGVANGLDPFKWSQSHKNACAVLVLFFVSLIAGLMIEKNR